MDPDHRAERAEQERQEQAARDARRDRVADYTPAEARPRRLDVPVLLGGPCDGQPLPYPERPREIRVTLDLRQTTDYRSRVWGMPDARYWVRAWCWVHETEAVQNRRLWDWLVGRALDV